jgi:hypothetical protein
MAPSGIAWRLPERAKRRVSCALTVQLTSPSPSGGIATVTRPVSPIRSVLSMSELASWERTKCMANT